jgi:hypothetical protein
MLVLIDFKLYQETYLEIRDEPHLIVCIIYLCPDERVRFLLIEVG